MVPGISNVVVRGGKTKEFVIVPEAMKMIPVGITSQMIIDAVLIDLVKQQGVNLIDFSGSVKLKAAEIRRQLPKCMELKPYYDQSAFVSNSIDSVLECIYEGLFLAIIVVIIFLRSFRASLNVILIITITLAMTFTVLYVAGITL